MCGEQKSYEWDTHGLEMEEAKELEHGGREEGEERRETSKKETKVT